MSSPQSIDDHQEEEKKELALEVEEGQQLHTSETGQDIAPTTSTSPSADSVSLYTNTQARIEVALYAAGRPLNLEELSRASRVTSKRKLVQLMHELAKKINSTFEAIELKEVEGPLYSLQLKPSFNSIAKKFATKPLLSNSTLRTLSYVVYLQPVSASELVLRRGSMAYSHLKELLDVAFVQAEKRGRTRVFRTTDSFADYFGLSHDADLQRKQVAKQGLVTKAREVETKEKEKDAVEEVEASQSV